MPTKTFAIQCSNKHNSIKVSSNLESLIIVSITIPDKDGKEYYVSSSSAELDGKVQYRYKTSSSPVVYLTVSHEFVNDFIIGDDITVEILMTRFVDAGKFVSEANTIAFGNKLNIHSLITNEADCGILCILHANCIKQHGSSRQFKAMIPLNENRLIAHKASDELLYFPQDLKMYYDGLTVDSNSYTVVNKNINASFTLDDKYVIYKREATLDVQLADDIFMDENYTISIYGKYDFIEYVVELIITSTNISKVESTPIIQSIALVSTNDN